MTYLSQTPQERFPVLHKIASDLSSPDDIITYIPVHFCTAHIWIDSHLLRQPSDEQPSNDLQQQFNDLEQQSEDMTSCNVDSIIFHGLMFLSRIGNSFFSKNAAIYCVRYIPLQHTYKVIKMNKYY